QYLEQLVKCLREKQLVESTRGAHGGYRLSRPPDQIPMGEVVRALEGPVAPMICATEGEMGIICDRLDGCSTKSLWARVRNAIPSTLHDLNVARLAALSGTLSSACAPTMNSGAQLVAFSPRLERSGRRSTAP